MRVEMEYEMKRIRELLVDFWRYIDMTNKNGEYGINVMAENILTGLFDIAFDCNLENTREYGKNYPGLDLADRENRISIQVTKSNNGEKVKDVLKQIKKGGMYSNYDHIYIFLYSEKEVPHLQQKTIDQITQPEFTFPKDNILNIEDICQKLIRKNDLDTLKTARKYLEKQLGEDGVKGVLRLQNIKKIIISIVVSLTVLICVRAVCLQALPQSSTGINPQFDDHLLLDLENANHQYEMGLENWRRLDYSRAERDILAACEETGRYISQGEIEVARMNNSLGCLYLDMGKYENAYDLLNSALVTFRGVYGKDSIEVRAVTFSIAQYDYYTGDFEKALQMAQEIIDQSSSEEDMVVIASISHFQAMIFDSLGDYDSAISVYEDVLSLYGDILEDQELAQKLSDYVHDASLDQSEKDYYTNIVKWIIMTYNNMGQVYIHMEQYGKAEAALQSGLDMSLDNIYIGRKNLTTSKLYMNLAIVDAKQNRLKEAVDKIDYAMRIQQNLFDYEKVYPGLVEVFDVYGRLRMMQGDYEGAEEYFNEALSLAYESFGENHPQTAEAYNMFGIYCHECGRYEEALSAFDKAITIRKNILGNEHPNTVQYYINLAETQMAAGKSDDAFDSLAEANAICDRFGIAGALLEKTDDGLKGEW